MPIDPIALRNRITFRLAEARHNTNPTTADEWLAVAKALLDFGFGPDSYTVKSDTLDNSPGFLDIKIKAGPNISLLVVDDAGERKIQISSTGGDTSANWDITKVRYFFIDGDNGNDANIGYIDDAPGTDFTSRAAEVASVAIKTTSRLEAITPFVGAGRMLVRLYKPRVGGAAYDLLTPGDGLGSEDRSGLSGYSILHTRGSDLSNSAADKLQLGFNQTRNDLAYVGPNPDGSFTVGAVTAGSGDGPEVQLLTANFADLHGLLKYRARFVTAGGATIYAPIRWGAMPGVASDVITFWFIPGPPISPGDRVFLERPGVALYTVSDASTYAAAVSTASASNAPASSIAGIEVVANTAMEFNIGTSDDTSANLCGVLSIYCKGRGSIIFAPEYVDETGTGFGPPSTSSFVAVHNFEGESWSGNLFNTTNAFNIQAASQSGEYCHFGYGTFDEASEYFSLLQCDFERVILSPANMVGVNGCRFYPTGASISLTVQPRSLGGADSGSVEVSIQDYCMLGRAEYIASGNDPSLYPWPSICLKNGQYTALLDFQTGTELAPATIRDGLGVQVEYSDDSSQFSLVTYDSLKTTGFEVIGGQKVVCKATGAVTGYAGDTLPCPRGVPMQIVNYPGCSDYPQPMPSGLVVAGVTDTGGEQAVFLNNGIYAPQNIIGATLTNYTNNADFGGGITGGWVVVGDDPVMVLRKDSVSAAPAIGAPVFVSFHDEFTPGLTGGFSVTEFQAGGDYPSYCLGHVLPIGNTAGISVPVFWKPSHKNIQIGRLQDAYAPFTKTNDVTLANIPGMFIMVEAGLTYRIDVSLFLLSFGVTPNGGFKVSIDGTGTAGSSAFLTYSFLQEYPDPTGAIRVPLLGLVQSSNGIGDANGVSYVGGTTGTMVVAGSILCTSGGYLYVRFAQSVATPGASSYVVVGSSITAVRQG